MRLELLAYAANDPHIASAAITGSAALEREDSWSDIDLAFGVKQGAERSDVLSEWTKRMYDLYGALHHLDVQAGAWIYRVFLLPSTLQVDLAFVAESEFCPLASTFRLVFGSANPAQSIPSAPREVLIGFGWLYALHARSCIQRGKLWQAEYMISALRDCALQLACARLGLPAAHGRGFDLLPDAITAGLAGALVREVSLDELWRAFPIAVHGLLSEMQCADQELASRLGEALLSIANRTTGRI